MSRYVWSHSKVRGPDGKTSTVTPGILDLMILGAEYVQRRRIIDITCPKCMGTCVESVCTSCGTIRPGPHSAWPRQPKTPSADSAIAVVIVCLMITFIVVFIALYIVGVGIMNG